jgi:hypothetical protein
MSNDKPDIVPTAGDQLESQAAAGTPGNLSRHLWDEMSGTVGGSALSPQDSNVHTARADALEMNAADLYGHDLDLRLTARRNGQIKEASAKGAGDGGGSRSDDSTTDKNQERAVFKPDGALDRELRRVSDLAAARIKSPEELAQFRRDMVAFEIRAATQGLSQDEVARTYGEISRILEAPGDKPISQADRIKIAEQVMHQAADPASIDQGKHVTCNVATIESRTYSRDPSAAARLVADVAISGFFETADGKIVKLGAESLRPDREAQNNPPKDGERSFASQLFNVTAVNIYMLEATAGQIRYEQKSSHPVLGDSGERLLDVSKNPPQELRRFNESTKEWNVIQTPMVPLDALPQISKGITGKFEKDLLVVPGNYQDNPNWTKVANPEEFANTLKELKKDGKLPVVLPVWSNNEPFLTDAGGGDPRGGQGQHVITITDYDEATGRVAISNQFGHRSDRSFSVEELYARTQSAYSRENVDALRQQVERNRAQGKVDTFAELEWVRVQMGAGMIQGEVSYDDALIKVMREAEQRWQRQKQDGTYDATDEERARAKLESISKEWGPIRKFRVRGRAGSTGRS